jgi:hypothetical protein
MEIKLFHSGRTIQSNDITFIKSLIAVNPGRSRRYISQEICRQWNWRYPNGSLKDMACRRLLKILEDKGFIIQPPKKRYPPNPLVNRKAPPLIKVDRKPLKGNLEQWLPLELKSVRKTEYEGLYNSLIDQYHYLKYTQPVGENIKYIAFSGASPLACLGWTSPVWYIGCRDRFIGWSSQIRMKNLHLIAYNTRFLILPWVQIPNLASHLLSRTARTLCQDWQGLYRHPIYFLETFVDKTKFKGTCYQAANWHYLGQTTGRGKLSQSHRPTRSLKDVYGYPLKKNFRELLCH